MINKVRHIAAARKISKKARIKSAKAWDNVMQAKMKRISPKPPPAPLKKEPRIKKR